MSLQLELLDSNLEILELESWGDEPSAIEEALFWIGVVYERLTNIGVLSTVEDAKRLCELYGRWYNVSVFLLEETGDEPNVIKVKELQKKVGEVLMKLEGNLQKHGQQKISLLNNVYTTLKRLNFKG